MTWTVSTDCLARLTVTGWTPVFGIYAPSTVFPFAVKGSIWPALPRNLTMSVSQVVALLRSKPTSAFRTVYLAGSFQVAPKTRS